MTRCKKPPMDMIQQTLQKAVDQLVIDLTDTIREATLNELAQILGVPNIPQLPPMSNRRHLKPAQTKGPTELPKQLGKALNKLKKSKRPVTSTMVAETLGTNENNARQVLAKLLKKRLVTTEMLGDGTARKVYLPAKS